MSREIQARIHEAAGVRRTRYPVTSGIPFPAGALRSHDAVRVLDADRRELPTIGTTLATWPDGSIKWLLLDTQVDVEPMAIASFTIEYGDRRSEAALPHLSVETHADAIEIDTGALRLALNRSGGTLFRSVTTGDGTQPNLVTSEGSGSGSGSEFSALDAEGTRYAAVIERAEVEEANPLRAVVLFTGGYEAADGRRLFGWQVRLYAFAGQRFVKLYHTFIHDQPADFVALKELRLTLPLALTGQRRAMFGARSYGLDAGYDVGPIDEYVQCVQPAWERHSLIRASAPRENRRTNSFGWLHLADDRHGVTLKLRHPYQNYPVACATDGAALELHLYPALSSDDIAAAEPETGRNWVEVAQQGGPTYVGPLRIPQGMAKTHEIMLSFGEPAGNPKAADRECLGFEMPLLLLADSAWYADSGALGAIAPYLPEHWPLEQRLRDFCELPNGAGIINYGDKVVLAPDPAPDAPAGRVITRTVENLAYDIPRSLLRQYLRTGNQPVFWAGEAAVMHLIDVDTIHYNREHPEWVGGPHMEWAQNHHYATTDETDQMRPTGTHTWVGGILDYYCLTGYRRALDVARQAVDFCRRTAPLHWQITPEQRARVLEPDEPWPYVTRVAAWPLLAMGQLYEFERDPELVPAMRTLVDLFAAWQDEDGRWRQPIGTFSRGGVPFMIAGVLQGLDLFARNFEDERAAEMLVRGARFAATGLVTPEKLFFYVEMPIAWRPHASDLIIIGALAAAFERSGDPDILDAAYRHFRWMVDDRHVSLYMLKDIFAALPLFARLGLLDAYRGIDMRAHLARLEQA